MNRKITFPRLPLYSVRKTLINVTLVVLIFLSGYVFGYKGYITEFDPYPLVTIDRNTPEEKSELDFGLFWKVWDTLDTRYFDKEKIIPAKMVYGSIQGMVASLGDPYTVFLPPNDNKVVQEDLSGSFEGVGIQIGFKGSQLAVIAPLPDSPAEKAGIEAGDFIIGIKDEIKEIDMGTLGITLPDAVQAIRGPKGTKVTLLLLRNGSDEVLEIDVIRDSIDVPSIILEFVGDQENIAHIKVLKFVEETKKEWNDAVIQVLTKPDVAGVIVDVRNNPGGYLQGAVDLASDFLEVGEIVVYEENSDGRKVDFKVKTLGKLRNKDVVVLVNKGSASASEIFAGALRDDKGIEIIGETTFGKGTIQESQQVDGNAGLHITIARWLTPSGFWVNEGGIVPDYEVEDNTDTEEDEQLQKAIELLENDQ
jgi:carboxyl-terminal processing protease